MVSHAGPQYIDDALYVLKASFNTIKPVPLPIPDKRDVRPNVVYSWTDDDKEEFELKSVRPRSNLTPKETGLTVAGR